MQTDREKERQTDQDHRCGRRIAIRYLHDFAPNLSSTPKICFAENKTNTNKKEKPSESKAYRKRERKRRE
jgi:hypothetical protein